MVKICFSQDENEMRSLLSERDALEPVVVFKDDGFLPNGMLSPYRYYVDGGVFTQREETPLLANFITVPDLWEIRMNYSHGEIWDEGIQKGKIEFAAPIEEHNAGSVIWYTPAGRICKKDYYDKFGKHYFSELCGEDETVNVRIYLSENKPAVMVQPKFDMYTLLREGKEERIFYSTREFYHYFMEEAFPVETDSKSDSLSKDILILTNSDRLECISVLVEKLKEFHFHIGAKTLMSEKLHRLTDYGNVSLYEGISETDRNKLLSICDYYFDINDGGEICDAVYEACRHGLLNFGFDNTIHDGNYLLAECRFPVEEVEKMISMIETLSKKPDKHTELVIKQFKGRRESNDSI